MNHLSPAAIEALSLSDEDRIQYILGGERWVEHPVATQGAH